MALLDALLSLLPQQGGGRDNDQKEDDALSKSAGLVIKAVWQLGGKQALIVPLSILALVLVFILFFNGGSARSLGGGSSSSSSSTGPTQPGGPSTPSTPPIAGFSIKITGPDGAPNGSPTFDPIDYIVTITYDPSVAKVPLSSIEIYDNTPTNATYTGTSGILKSSSSPHVWSLAEPQNQSSFTITLTPTTNDSIISYTVSARAIASTGGTGSGGNECTKPFEGTGYCSTDNLAPTFGGNQQQALIASMICQAESTSNPFALNTTCDATSNDYSVGLFQINLVVHCPGAYANSDCEQLIDAGKRAACEAPLKDPVANIQKMYALSAGTYWTPWSTWPKVQGKLQSCGIL